jgi:hypothetical protein
MTLYNKEIMLAKHEETQILQGIDNIMFNLRHVPTEDVAYFLVKFDPKLADKLAAAIEQNFFEKTQGKSHE